MKTCFSVILALVFFSSLFGQDLSVFNRNTSEQEGQYLMPWITGEINGVFYDVRYNFDQPKTIGIFVGKLFTAGENFVIIPEIGILDGMSYSGISPELLLVYENSYMTAFLMNQYSFKANDASPDYLYHWGQFLGKVTNEFRIGFAEQIYFDDTMDKESIDIGPTIKYFIGRFYINPWATIDFDSKVKKFFLGIGYIFE